jgi:NAD(P)H dehydrogenase (quinone)
MHGGTRLAAPTTDRNIPTPDRTSRDVEECRPMSSSVQVYVIYDGDPDGPIDRMAHAVVEGAASVDGASVLVHTAQQATVEDMVSSDAIILGSPNWHGMTADLKQVVDKTGLIWEQGKLVGKVGAAFTSGWSRAGGQEITLLTMLHSLLAHGMLIVGLPWSKRMVKSGSYYGPTATGGPTADDLGQAHALGRRVAHYAVWLQRGRGSDIDEIEGGLFYQQRRGHVVTR